MYDGEESCDAFNKKGVGKRFPSAFILFSTHYRRQIREEEPEKKYSFGALSRLVGEKWKNISKEEKVRFKDKARKIALERLAQQEKKAFNLSLAKQQQQHQLSWNEQQPHAPGHPPGPRTQPSINPVIEGSENAMTTEGNHVAIPQQLFLNENNRGASAISYLNFVAHTKSRLGPEDDSHCIHQQPDQLTKYGPNHSDQMIAVRSASDGVEFPTVDGLRTYPPYHPLMKHKLGNVGHSQGPSFPTTNHGFIDVRPPLPSSNHGLVNRRPTFPTSNNALLDLRPSLSTMNNGLIDLRPAYPPSNYGLRDLTPSCPSTNRFLDLTPSMPTMNNGLIDLRPANPASNYGLLDLRPTYPSSNNGLLDLNPAFPLPHNGLIDLGPSLPTSNSGLLDLTPSLPITNYGSIQPRQAYPTPTPHPQFDALPHVQQGGLNTSSLRQMQTEGQNSPMPSLQPFPQEVYNNLQQARPVPVHSGHGGLVHHRMPFLSVSANSGLSYSKQEDDNPITPSLVVCKKTITQTKEQDGPNLDLQLHKHLLNSTCGNNLRMNLPKKGVETSLKQSESNQPQQIINIKDDEKYICICPQCGKKGFPSDGRFTCKSCNVVYMNMKCAYCSSGQFETPNALQEHLQICRGKFLAENRLIGHTNHDKQSYTDITFTKHPDKCNQESVTSTETEASLGKEKAKKLKQCFVQMKNVLQKHSSIVKKIYTSPEQNRMKSKALGDSTVIASLENCANKENDYDVKGIDSERTMTGVEETQGLDSNDSMSSVSNSCEYSESEASDSSGYEEIELDDDQATIDTVEIVKEYQEERFSEIPDKKSNISNASETANGTERPKGVITAREAKKLMSVGLNIKQPGKTIPSPKTAYEIRKEKMNSTKGNSISENPGYSGKEDKVAKPRSCKNNSNSELNQTKIDDFSRSLNKKRTVAKTKILTRGKSKKETFYSGGNVSLEITTDPESDDEFHANSRSSQTIKKAIKEAHISNHSETLSTDKLVSDNDSETESTDTYESEYESFTEIDVVSSANEREKSSHATDKSKSKKSYKQPVHDKRKRKPTKQSRKRLRLERVAKRKAEVIAKNTDTESSDENEIVHRSSRIKARKLGVTIADNPSSDESETVIVPRVTRSKDKTKVNEKQKNNRRSNTGKNVTLSKDSVIQNTLKRMLDERDDESEYLEKEDEDVVNEENGNVKEDDMSENDFNFMAYKTRKMAGLYSCKKCSKSFRTLYTLAKHMRTHSSASINESADLTGGNSDICVELVSTPNKVIKNTDGISSAQVEVTKEIPAPEHNANVTDISKSSDGTVPMEFICGICGVNFETEVLLDIHWKMHTSSPLKGQFQCGICKAVYHSSEHLERHVFTHNPATMGKLFSISIQNSEVSTDEEFICGVCQRKFAVAEELHSHIISHSSTVFCQSCNRSFASLSELNNHCAQEHGPQIEHSCSTCSVAYKTYDELKVHMQDHTKLVASQRKVTSDVVVEKMQADSCSLELAGKAEIKTEGQKTNCGVHLTTTMNKLSAKLVDKNVDVMEPKRNDEDVKEQKEKVLKNPNEEELKAKELKEQKERKLKVKELNEQREKEWKKKELKEQKERKLKVKELNEQREKELKKKELKKNEVKEKELKKQEEKKSKVKKLNEQNEKEKEQKKELEEKQNKVVEEAEKKKNISKLLSYKIKFL